MALPRMYTEFAYLWRRLSPPERYRDEARRWKQLIRLELGVGKHRVLELGVGGGHFLSHLTDEFEATAVDISQAMLDSSLDLNPQVRHVQGDMRSVRLEETFQAVLIHDSIAYMLEPQDVDATLMTAWLHLEPGGLLVLAPDYVRESFPGPHLEQYDCGAGVSVLEWCRQPDPTNHRIETLFVYIFRQGPEVRTVADLHRMSVFPVQFWLEALQRAGFEATSHPDLQGSGGQGASLFSGRKIVQDAPHHQLESDPSKGGYSP